MMKLKLKKRTKIILIVLVVVLGVFILFGTIDYNRTKEGKEPIMSIYVGKSENTNAKMWYGFGYAVIKCPDIEETEDFKTDNDRYRFAILSNHHICAAGFYVEENEEEVE